MGTTQSKSTAMVATDVITQSVMKNITSCVTTASQDQSIVISNTVGDVTLKNVLMSQSASINSQCLQQILGNSTVQNTIANDVVQSANTETQALLGLVSGNSSSTTEANVRTTIKNLFTTENINETVNNLKQNQSINISSTIGNVVIENLTMEQGLQLAAKTFVDATNILKALNDVQTKLDQSSNSTSKGPFDFITDAIAEYGVIIGIVIVLIVFIVAGVLVFKWYAMGSTEATVGDIVTEAKETATGGIYEPYHIGGVIGESIM